jgi:hypothetical protein
MSGPAGWAEEGGAAQPAGQYAVRTLGCARPQHIRGSELGRWRPPPTSTLPFAVGNDAGKSRRAALNPLAVLTAPFLLRCRSNLSQGSSLEVQHHTLCHRAIAENAVTHTDLNHS